MHNIPAHKQRPQRIQLSASSVAAMESLGHHALVDEQIERACSTCIDQHAPASQPPCVQCLPKAATLPNWRSRALASRPDPGVQAIAALERILVYAKAYDDDIADLANDGKRPRPPEGGDYNNLNTFVQAEAYRALKLVAERQAETFVPVSLVSA